MRKLRIVLKENKNSLLNEVSYFRGQSFRIHQQLLDTLRTKDAEKLRSIEEDTDFRNGFPQGSSLANYTALQEAINRLDENLSRLDPENVLGESDAPFIALLRQHTNTNLFFKTVDENGDSIPEALKLFYRATVTPLLLDETKNANMIAGTNILYNRSLVNTLQAIQNYEKKLMAGQGANKFVKFFVGPGAEQKKELIGIISNLIKTFINNVVQYKINSDSYAQKAIQSLGAAPAAGGGGTTAPPEGGGGTVTPPEGGGAAGGGEPPPTTPPTGTPPTGTPPATPPTGTPSSRVIPISSGLYRDLTAGGIPRTVALEIVRALRADLEGAGYTLRESLNTAKPTLTDILLREEYIYTSALHDLLLLEGKNTQAIRRERYAKQISQLSNKRQNRKQSLETLDTIETQINSDYKSNLLRNDDLTSLQSAIEKRREDLGGKAKVETSPTKDDSPSTPEAAAEAPTESIPDETPEAPSSDESVDYWDQYFVKRYGTQLYRIQAMEALKAGNFKDFIDKYLKWVLNQKVDIEKKAGVKLSDISNIKEAVSDDEAEKKRKLADTKKYNTNLANFDKKTGGTFLKNYTNLINAIRKIKELSDLTGFNSPETAKELGDTKAIMQHIKAAFPKETGFNDDVHKKIFDLFTKYTKEKLKPYERGYKSAESNNLVKDLGKKKVIDQKNLAQFVKSLNGKTEADRAALKKINVQNVAVKTVKNFLSNYGIRLGENRYQAIANVLITESAKHYNLVREYHEHVNNNLLPYMQKQIGFNRPPTINFVDDPINAQNPFGKTAYYDPQLMEITVYTTGRHPKDIMRSVAHEVIHHAQNCRGQLDPQRMGEASEGYAQKNPYLRKLEEEAYLLGNMTFRDWEDGMKTNQLNEMHDCNKVHPNKSHAAYKREDKNSYKEISKPDYSEDEQEKPETYDKNKDTTSKPDYSEDEQEKPETLEEWRNNERWDLLMKRFKIVSEKRFANDPKLDKDGDGKPKWADEDDDSPKDSKKQVKGKK